MASINTKVLLLILIFIAEGGVRFPREEKKKIGILQEWDVKSKKPKFYAILIVSIFLILVNLLSKMRK